MPKYTSTSESKAISKDQLQLLLESRSQSLLSVGIRAMELAREMSLSSIGKCSTKNDNTPVTVADLKVEEFIKKSISAEWPEDVFLGEETSEIALEKTPPADFYRWIVVPIDGTEALIHGVPLFAVLIAVQKISNGVEEIVAGAAFFPMMHECIIAQKNIGAWHSKSLENSWYAARARSCGSLRLAKGCITTVEHWFDNDARATFFNHIARQCAGLRGWGDALGYLLVATGRADFMLDATIKFWDIAAWLIIIPEAGGKISDLNGSSFDQNKKGGILATGCTRSDIHSAICNIWCAKPINLKALSH